MTTYFGACDVCNAGYWVDCESGPGGQMLGPHVIVVCQRHLPVGEARCASEHMMGAQDRQRWQEWRVQAEAELAARS